MLGYGLSWLGGSLPPAAIRIGVFDRLPALRPAIQRCADRGRRFAWCFPAGDTVSVGLRCAGAAGRGAALRVGCRRRFALATHKALRYTGHSKSCHSSGSLSVEMKIVELVPAKGVSDPGVSSILLPSRPVEVVDVGMAVETSARKADTTSGESMPLLRVAHLRKEYRTGRGNLVLFSGLDFDVQAGEMVAVVGQSGAGKSTLLHILGALDRPSSGDVYFASTPLSSLNSTTRPSFAIARSVTSGNSITSCLNSRRSKM